VVMDRLVQPDQGMHVMRDKGGKLLGDQVNLPLQRFDVLLRDRPVWRESRICSLKCIFMSSISRCSVSPPFRKSRRTVMDASQRLMILVRFLPDIPGDVDQFVRRGGLSFRSLGEQLLPFIHHHQQPLPFCGLILLFRVKPFDLLFRRPDERCGLLESSVWRSCRRYL